MTRSIFDYVKFKDIPNDLKFIKAFWDVSQQQFENDIVYAYEHKKSNTHYLFISIGDIFDVAKISGENQKQQIKDFVEFVILKSEKVNSIMYTMHRSISYKPKFIIKLFKGNNTYIQMITQKGRGKIQTIPNTLENKTLQILEKDFWIHYYLHTIKRSDLILQLLKMERGEKHCS